MRRLALQRPPLHHPGVHVNAHERCDYAACTSTAVHSDLGWDFCSVHWLEHRADIHGEKWPNMPSVQLSDFGVTFGRGGRALMPCGTDAAYRRHERLHEPVCDVCKASRRKDPYPPARQEFHGNGRGAA